MRKIQNIKLESVKDKSTLVKLLAEEDVTVSYQKASTASFNPNTREVILPIWKDKSESVMDMMSLHEVGHALYTPLSLLEDGQKKNVKHSFLNVLEDVRIEKMIQDKYLGSVRVFKTAYKELLKKDFFGIKGKDLSKLNLIDRINMHYKNVSDVPFDNDELEWVDKANQTKTSDDVLNLAIELQEWMKSQNKDLDSDDMFKLDIAMPSLDEDEDSENQENKEDNQDSDSNQDSEDNSDNDSDNSDDSEDDSEDDSNSGKSVVDENAEDGKSEKMETKSQKGAGDSDEGIDAMTDTNYSKKQFEAVDKNAPEIEYLNIPKVNLKEVIVDYKQVISDLSSHYKDRCKGQKQNTEWYDWVKKDIAKFKKEQSQTISYMVKEFEMKKSADLYKRSTISKTGKLNMNTLHSYSYNEDIFLKMNVEPGATSHGLVMFVDWSGSMQENFYNTIKQTLNLVWFCERVNIPFEVYGFTNGYSNRDDTMKNTKIQKPKQNDLIINELRLLNFLSSRSNKKDMQEGLTNLWAMANYWAERYEQNKNRISNDRLYSIYLDQNYSLHSTPLNHSIVAAMDLVPKFKKDNGVQKVHTVFLTDGYSNPITNKYNWSMQDDRRPSDKYDSNDNPIPLPNDYQGHMTSTSTKSYYGSVGKTIITDSVNKKKFICTDDKFTYGNQTRVLLEFLKSREPNMTVTNFFIASSNKKGTISRNDIISIFGLRWEDEDKAKAIQKEIKKNNVAVCTNQGWDEMYVLPGGEKLDISDDDMSQIVPGVAKKGDLKRAFSKMTSGRKNSRPLLNKFIGMIA